MPILNSHALSRMKVMGLIGFWYWVNKQWGTHSAGNPGQVTLPIAFSSILYAVIVATYADENVATTNAAYNYTKSSFNFRDNHQIAYVALGR